MATGGNGISLTTTPTVVMDVAAGDKACEAIFVSNRSGSTGNVLVNVAGLHNPADFAGIAPGQTIPFKFGGNGVNAVTKVTLKSDGGTTTADWGVMSRS